MDTLTQALTANGPIHLADVDHAIVMIGGTRGLTQRGRILVTTATEIFVLDIEGLVRFSRTAAVRQFETVEAAEAFVRRERAGVATIRAIAADMVERAGTDGKGWGN